MIKRAQLRLAVILVCATVLSGCGKRSESSQEKTVAETVNVQGKAEKMETEEGEAVRLEDDYYNYINRDILSKTEIPGDSSSWSYFYKLDQDAYEVLNDVLKEAVEKRSEATEGSVEQKIADLYLTAMDMEGREKAGLGSLKPYVDGIRNAANIEEYLTQLGTIYGDLGHGSIITSQWFEDLKDSNRYALYVDGADLGLGKETLEDQSQIELIQKYEDYVGQTLIYAGLGQEEAKTSASEIVGLQKDLAKSALSLSEQNDPAIIYNSYTMEELKSLLPGADMEKYLEAAGLTDISTCIVTQEEQMKQIGDYLKEEHLPLLKNYSIFVLINDFAPYLTPEIRNSWLDWNNVQNGIAEKKEDEKLAGELTQDMLGFEFGKLYVEKTFFDEEKESVKTMVNQIISAYKNQIMELDWMGDETKTEAVKKLDHMTLKIGYPDRWPEDHEKAAITSKEAGGNLINNVISLIKAENEVNQEKFRKPVDKTEWGLTPQTVNAYYNPTGNEIVFPAGILQAPFYDPEADINTNLGGIGMVIAHEISHAFDASGSLYDETGNYHVWWTDEDRAKFEKLADQVVSYYNGQEGFEGRMVNGKQTLNENIADLGAMSCVTSIVGEDEEKLKKLFENYAVIWASKYTPESMIRRLNTDTHSPAGVRVNAVLGTLDSFYKAYPEINEKDAMYVAPDKRVKIW